MAGRHCPKRLWLSINQGELAAESSVGDRARRVTGETLGRMARELFPGGVLVATMSNDPETAATETSSLIASGTKVLFEAAFWVNDLFVRCDVLKREGDAWRLIEFKSSTKIKDEHIEDLAFQVMVLRKSGLNVKSASIGHIDSTNERGEMELGSAQLFALEDVTASIEKLLPQVVDWSTSLVRLSETAQMPEVATNTFCSNPIKCPFYDHCHEGQPPNDILKLPGIRPERVIAFRDNGIHTIGEIPEGEKLAPMQRRAYEVVRFDRPYIGETLTKHLAKIQFPAHFIDFEAAGPALPLFSGMRPYQAFPFQWSDHRLDSIDADSDHDGFLDTSGTDPRHEFAETLFQRIKDAVTVVFYSSYELTTVRALAKANVPYGQELVDILESRGFDLYRLVKDEVYLSDFEGSFSIKKVLPALVPDSSYDGLEIKDGDTAAVEYLRMHALGTTETARQQIAQSLNDYCRQDTLAMVQLYRALAALA